MEEKLEKKEKTAKKEAEGVASEEKEAKFMEKLQGLLAMAKKKKNMLEYQEISDYFRELELNAEQFEKILDFLEANNIDVLRITDDDDDVDEELLLNDDEEEIKKNPNAKTAGFVTNESNAVGKVNTKSAVLDIAKKEVGEKFNKVNFAFDRTQGIWRVTFSMDTVTDENTTSEKIMTVYIDEDGYTLATIKA